MKKEELGKSLNTDESAALGAAYQAAYLSKGFKVKTFLIKDANIYPIQVSFSFFSNCTSVYFTYLIYTYFSEFLSFE